MRKLLVLSFIMCSVLAACGDGDGNEPKEIVLKDGSQASQTIYANETKGKDEGIRFSTTGPWTAEVTEATTRAAGSEVDWLKLNQYSGDKAGDYTLTLTLKENLTGADRKAVIRISCNGTTITITVEQKAKKEDGTIPEFQSGKLLSQVQYKIEYDIHGNGGNVIDIGIATFTYDDRNRVIKISNKDEYGDESSSSFTYSDHAITEKYDWEEDNYSIQQEIIYTLDADNKRVESWTNEERETQNGEDRGYWKGKGTHHYNEAGYLMSVDIRTESLHGISPDISENKDVCEWKDGNLIKAGEEGKSKYTTLVEYSDIDNTGNLDLNFLVTQTEWLDCLAFEEAGIKAFGYIGKRSAKLMKKETDQYDNHYYTYEYKMNEDGTVGGVTVTEYASSGTMESKRVYTLTYIDAN